MCIYDLRTHIRNGGATKRGGTARKEKGKGEASCNNTSFLRKELLKRKKMNGSGGSNTQRRREKREKYQAEKSFLALFKKRNNLAKKKGVPISLPGHVSQELRYSGVTDVCRR